MGRVVGVEISTIFSDLLPNSVVEYAAAPQRHTKPVFSEEEMMHDAIQDLTTRKFGTGPAAVFLVSSLLCPLAACQQRQMSSSRCWLSK